jgi:hypothetical protein
MRMRMMRPLGGIPSMAQKSEAELLLDAGLHIPPPATNAVGTGALVQPQQQTGIMDLMRRAFDAGNLELVERAMALQERWENNQARRAFERAMAQARGKIGTILKNRAVDYTGAKGRVNYAYEDLAAVTEALDKVIPDLELNFRFRTKVDGKTLTVTLVLSHSDGYSEENSLSAAHDDSGQKNSIQAAGSTQTYLERYLLKAGFGLAAAEADDDGQAHAQAPIVSITEAQVETIKQALKVREMPEKRLLDYVAASSHRKYRPEKIADIPAELFEFCLLKIRTAGEPQ